MKSEKQVREQAEAVGLRLYHPRGKAYTKFPGRQRKVRTSPYTLLTNTDQPVPVASAATGKGLGEIGAYLTAQYGDTPPLSVPPAPVGREDFPRDFPHISYRNEDVWLGEMDALRAALEASWRVSDDEDLADWLRDQADALDLAWGPGEDAPVLAQLDVACIKSDRMDEVLASYSEAAAAANDELNRLDAEHEKEKAAKK